MTFSVHFKLQKENSLETECHTNIIKNIIEILSIIIASNSYSTSKEHWCNQINCARELTTLLRILVIQKCDYQSDRLAVTKNHGHCDDF